MHYTPTLNIVILQKVRVFVTKKTILLRYKTLNINGKEKILKNNAQNNELFFVRMVLIVHSKNYFFHCKKCDNDWFII
jgi:hypothetical protein